MDYVKNEDPTPIFLLRTVKIEKYARIIVLQQSIQNLQNSGIPPATESLLHRILLPGL